MDLEITERDYMQIITDKHGFVHASFNDFDRAKAFWDAMPEAVRAQYKLHGELIDYPYFYIWMWDYKDGRDESKWKVEIKNEREVNEHLKNFKRDKAIEEGVDWDDQYFYLGEIYEDGVSYKLRKDLGMPTGIGARKATGLQMLDSHYHMDWDSIIYFRNVGVKFATAPWSERIKMRKAKRKARKIRRLRRLYAAGKLKDGSNAMKTLRNAGWLKPTALPYIDPKREHRAKGMPLP